MVSFQNQKENQKQKNKKKLIDKMEKNNQKFNY